MSPPRLSQPMLLSHVLQHWTDASIAIHPRICRSLRSSGAHCNTGETRLSQCHPRVCRSKCCCPMRCNTRQTLTSASVAFISSACRLKEGRNDFRFKRFMHGFDSNLLNYKKYILANTLFQFGCVDQQTPKSKVNGPRVHFPYT
jgi:hypothetical protein